MAPAMGFSSGATLHRLQPSMATSSSFRIPSVSSPAPSDAHASNFEPLRVLGLRMHNASGAIRSCLGRTEQNSVARVVPARQDIYSEAVRALATGHVVAVPTDTLYGLACDASSPEAIRRVYEIKERKLSSPLAVCVADVDAVPEYAETAHLPAGLLSNLLPGAVTLLLPRRENGRLSQTLNPGVESIGIRIPESDFIRGLSRSFGGALALTSANTSSHVSTVRVAEFEHLWPHCAFVFDAGTLPGGRAGSTIVDLTQEGLFKVVRSGSVLQKTRETLTEFGFNPQTPAKGNEFVRYWEARVREPDFDASICEEDEDGNLKYTIREDHEELNQVFENYGPEVYEAVCNAHLQVKEHGAGTTVLWHYGENRKATLSEVVERWNIRFDRSYQ